MLVDGSSLVRHQLLPADTDGSDEQPFRCAHFLSSCWLLS